METKEYLRCTVSAELLSQVLESLRIVEEGHIIVNEEGLMVREMDLSQIALTEIIIPKSQLTESKVHELTNFAVDFSELWKYFKEKQTLGATEAELIHNGRFHINFNGKPPMNRTFPIVESSSWSPPKNPKIDYPMSIEVDSAYLRKCLEAAALCGNHIVFRSETPTHLTFKGEGDEGNYTIKPEVRIIKRLSDAGIIRATYAIDQLLNLIPKNFNVPLTISFRTDAPIKIEYKLGHKSRPLPNKADFEKVGRISVTHYLAPRIESV
jgi:hypothetical protein